MFESFIKKIIEIDGITGCIAVNPQDGTIFSQEGNVDPALEDITAFFGSGFDVVASSMGIKGLKFNYLEKENQKIIILVEEGGYIGCKLSKDGFFEAIIKQILEIEKTEVAVREVEEVGVSTVNELSEARRFLKSKIHQINLLIDEFSEGVDRNQWVNIVKEKFSEKEKGKKITNMIRFADNIVVLDGELDPEVKGEDISTISKIVTDSLCKKAVEKFGPTETKKKVHNVIDKLGITR